MGFPLGTMFVTAPTPSWTRCVSAVWHSSCRAARRLFAFHWQATGTTEVLHFILFGWARAPLLFNASHLPCYASMCPGVFTFATLRIKVCFKGGQRFSLFLLFFMGKIIIGAFPTHHLWEAAIGCLFFVFAAKMKRCSHFHSYSKRQRSCCRAGHEPGL